MHARPFGGADRPASDPLGHPDRPDHRRPGDHKADQIAASIKAQNKYVSKEIDANADELAKQIKAAEGS